MKTSVNLILYSLLLILSLLLGLAGCDFGKTTNTISTQLNNSLLYINAAASIPLLKGQSISSSTYVTNDSDTNFSDINYTIKDSGITGIILTHPTECSDIKAHSSCQLYFTVPSIKIGTSASSVIEMNVNRFKTQQIINYYTYQNNESTATISFSNDTPTMVNDRAVVLYLVTNGNITNVLQNLKLYTIPEKRAILISGINKDTKISNKQVLTLQIRANMNKLTNSNLTKNNEQLINLNLSAQQENFNNNLNAAVTLQLVPSSGVVLSVSNISYLAADTTTQTTVTLLNNGLSDITGLSINLPSTLLDFVTGSNNCSSGTLSSGSSCTFKITRKNLASLNGTISYIYSVGSLSSQVVGAGDNTMPNLLIKYNGSTIYLPTNGSTKTFSFDITNIGNDTAGIFSITPSLSVEGTMYYNWVNHCGSSLAPNASCKVDVSVIPYVSAPATANILLQVVGTLVIGGSQLVFQGLTTYKLIAYSYLNVVGPSVINEGATITLTVQEVYTDGSTITISNSNIKLTTSNAYTIETIGDYTGMIKGLSPGTAIIGATVTTNGRTGSTSINVTSGASGTSPVTGLDFSVFPTSVPMGISAQLKLIAHHQNGIDTDVTLSSTVSYFTSGWFNVNYNNGTIVGIKVQSGSLMVQYGGIAAYFYVAVTPAIVQQLTISLESSTGSLLNDTIKGGYTQYYIHATFSDGTYIANYSNNVSWIFEEGVSGNILWVGSYGKNPPFNIAGQVWYAKGGYFNGSLWHLDAILNSDNSIKAVIALTINNN